MNVLDKTTFAARLGETFIVHPESGDPVTLVLTEVSRASEPVERPFTLLFHAPDGAVLTQRTYEVENAAMGRFDLFLVPVGPDPETRWLRYEAVFN